MPSRWWGRGLGSTIATILLAGSSVAGSAGAGEPDAVRWELVGRAADGAVVLRLPLTDGRFTLEYRNSLYRSRAAEHFSVTDDGRLALTGLAAIDAAVRQVYYGAIEPPHRAYAGTWAGWWHAPAAEPLELDALPVLASRHGERTLVAGDGSRFRLWKVTADGDPTITLEAHRSG